MHMNPKRPAAAFLSAVMLLGMFSPPAQALNTGSTADPDPAATQSLGDHPIQILPELDHDGSPETETTPDRIDWLPLVPAAKTIPALKLTPAQKAEQSETPAEPEEEELPEIQLFARDEVYTSATASNHVHSGDGTYANPYNLFEDAVKNTVPGGKIIIKNKAFLNAQDEGGTLPYIIDRPLTITSEHADSPASLQVRAGGIVLGDNVTIENVNLNFENRTHDAFFANGHTLTLKNVLRSNGSREVDLFGGHLRSGNTIYGASQAGKNSKIVIEMKDPKLAPKSSVHLGNIYAGSMNDSFNGSTTVEIKSESYNGDNFIGEIYASGAKEADPGNMLDPKEPAPPVANASTYPMHGSVKLDFDSLPLRGSSKSPMLIDGTTGSSSKTSLSVSVDSPTSNLKLKDIYDLTVNEGTIQPSHDTSKHFNQIKIESNAQLDLTKGTEKDFTVATLSGNGTLTLKKDGSLTVENSFNDSELTFQTEGAWNGKSGMVEPNQTYINVPSNSNGNFKFTPDLSQKVYQLVKNNNTWIIQKNADAPVIHPIVKLQVLKPKGEDNSPDGSPDGPQGEPEDHTRKIIYTKHSDTAEETQLKFEVEFPTIVDSDPDSGSSSDEGSNKKDDIINDISPFLQFFVSTSDSPDPIPLVYNENLPGHIAPGVPFIIVNDTTDQFKPTFTIYRVNQEGNDFGEEDIPLNTYEIEAQYPDVDGVSREDLTAKVYLTSVPNPPEPDPDTGASNSQIVVTPSPASTTFGEKINISASISNSKMKPQLFSATAIEKDKAYLYVNGKSVNNAAPVTNETVVFSDISVDEKNGFRAGANQISVVYGGGTLDSAKLNGSAGSATIDVKKADSTIELTNKDTPITVAYTGTNVVYAPEIKVTAGTNKLQVSNPKITVTYLKDGQAISGAPNVPGTYITKVRVEEGSFYNEATADGPTITIKQAAPIVTATGTIDGSNLVLTANVQGIDSGILPTGTVAFSMKKGDASHPISSNTAEVRYNTATLTIPKPEEGTYEITATYKPSSESLYKEASSDKITLKIAKDHKPLNGIKLNHETLSMVKGGQTQTLTVTYDPTDATNQEVVWTSLNPEIASVNNSGQVTAIKAGTATIQARATAGDHIATCLVTVTDETVEVTKVVLDRTTLTMAKNQTDQLSVKVEPYNATITNITWASDNATAVEVDAKTGKITAKAATNGTPAKITATVNGTQTAVATITVEDDVAITKIDLTPSNLTLEKDQSASLTASITPDNASNQELIWASSHPDLVSIQSPSTGKTVTIVAKQKTQTPVTITVSSKQEPKKTATATVTVTEPTAPTPPPTPAEPTINITPNTLTLTANGASQSLTAKVTDGDASKVQWSIKSNNNLISLTATSGETVTVKANNTNQTGQATVEASYTDTKSRKTVTATATVTVEASTTPTPPTPPTVNPTIKITPKKLSLKVDETGMFTAAVENGDSSNHIQWTIENDTQVVRLDTSTPGKIIALTPGTAVIKATYTSQSGVSVHDTATVEVSAKTPPTVPVTKVSINETGLSLKKGQTGKFTATVLPSGATNPAVTWSSDHSDIASVDPKTGVVTAHKNGQATIKVTSDENNQLTDSRTVTVIDIPVTEVKIIEAPLSLREGRGAQLVVRVSPSDATDPSVKWESDDTDVLTVDRDGYVTAERRGSATITVTSVAHPELKDSRTISVTRSSSGGSSGGSSHKPSKPDNKPKPEATKPEPPKPTVPTPQIPQTVKPEPPKPGTPVIASAPPVNPTLNTTFTDIPTTHWASEPIKDVVSRGLFVGTEKGNFSPDESMTRAMVVTVLHRLAGEPMVQSANQFTDVGRTYYTDAVTWANQNHIVSGTSANTFAPNLMVTREELVVMLYRVANPVAGSSADLTRFADSGKVSSWASTPMQWAVQTGILKGSDGALLPQNKLSRAEAASLISRFTEQFLTQ